MLNKFTFTLALMCSATLAASDRNNSNPDEHQEFINFAAQYNKHYHSTEDIHKHEDCFHKNVQKIKELNERNPKAKFGVNKFTDLDDDEINKMLGVMPLNEQKEKAKRKEKSDNNGNKDKKEQNGGRRLQEKVDRSINWVHLGKTTGVKDQGACGSCWAFSATVVQEAMQSIHTGDAPVRLSEQEAVDCEPISHGCRGGLSDAYMRWSAEHGSLAYDEYPY